jgi:fluoride ion exporter CrcB/FEX
VKMTDDSLSGFCSSPQRDRRNQRRVTLWSLVWAFCFIALSLGIMKKWLPFGLTLAGVIGTALLGIATILAQRRFLQETDELRRKIEVEALALAFGVGVIGGITDWLLEVSRIVPPSSFIYVVCMMMLTYSAGVLIGRRRYS